MDVRKQVYELTSEDLNCFPVWEFALDEEDRPGQDEATVRPFEVAGALDPSLGMFIVRAEFTLADGSRMHGYLTPPIPRDSGFGYSQPVVITPTGQIAFWRGISAPSPEELAKYYLWLGRSADRVFPIHFQSEVELTYGRIIGEIAGFMVKSPKSDKFKLLI